MLFLSPTLRAAKMTRIEAHKVVIVKQTVVGKRMYKVILKLRLMNHKGHKCLWRKSGGDDEVRARCGRTCA